MTARRRQEGEPLRTLEGTTALRQEQGAARLVLSLFWPGLPIAALVLFAMLSQSPRKVLAAAASPLAMVMGLASVLGILVFLGLLTIRVRSTAEGLNEFPPLTGRNLASSLVQGFRTAVLSAAVGLPLLALAYLSAALMGLVGGLSMGIPTMFRLGTLGGSSFGIVVSVILIGTGAVVLPSVLVQGAILPNFWAALSPGSVFSHVRQASREYLASVSLLLAGGTVLLLVGGLLTALGFGTRGTPLAEQGWLAMVIGDTTCLVLLLLFLFILVAHWFGQYAYLAYAEEVEHLVLHEEVDPLTPAEAARLSSGTVAYLGVAGGTFTPVEYVDGEYRLPGMQHKSVSRQVLRQLDAQDKVEWLDPLHRRNVMTS